MSFYSQLIIREVSRYYFYSTLENLTNGIVIRVYISMTL